MIRYTAALGYFTNEALTGLWRSKGVNSLAVAIISAALLIVGIFLLAASNMQDVVDSWGEGMQVTLFVEDGIAPDTLRSLRKEMKRCPLVESVQVVDKLEARRRFQEFFPGLREIEAEIETNPFPASLEATLDQGYEEIDTELLRRYAARWAELDGVAEVQMDLEWLENLSAAVAVVRLLGLLFGAITAVAAALTITAVIRLAMHSRSDELEIMRIVGATTVYVKGPHIMEGLLLGLLGGIFSLMALYGTWSGFLYYLRHSSDFLFSFLVVDFLSWPWMLALLLAGLLLGLGGSIIALTLFPSVHTR